MKRDHSDIVKVDWARPRANSDRLPPGPKRRTDWADVLSEQHALSEPSMVPRAAGYPPLAASPLLPPTPVHSANAVQVGGEHYKTKTIQMWDYIASNHLDYFQGNIVKYVSRWKLKGGLEDLQKARHYLDKYIELQTQQPESK